MCEHDKLNHYHSLIMMSNPAESQLLTSFNEKLNAEVRIEAANIDDYPIFVIEIALRTVANVEEAIQWLSYTYLYVRMLKNPSVYGLTLDEIQVSIYTL